VICSKLDPKTGGFQTWNILPIAQLCQNFRYVDGIAKKLEPIEIWVNLPISKHCKNYRYEMNIKTFLLFENLW